MKRVLQNRKELRDISGNKDKMKFWRLVNNTEKSQTMINSSINKNMI